MFRQRCLFAGLLAILIMVPTLYAADMELLPLKQVHQGMKCQGLSSFSGTKLELEDLDVEIIGVVRHGSSPDSNMIIAKVDSPSVQRGGIMSGMSGSPVYYQGKLLGAISSAFPYAKEPICGITPIEAMTRLWDLAKAPMRKMPVIPRRDIFSSPQSRVSSQLLPIGLSINTRGLDTIPDNSNITGQWITTNPDSSPGATGNANTHWIDSGINSLDPVPSIIAGQTIGVGIVGGDVEMVAYGTVTHVTDDGRFLAFGHSSFGIGNCELPLFDAQVVSFVPNQIVSFKLANIGGPIGSLTFDAAAGITGVVGKWAKTIPVEVSIHGLTPQSETYNLWVFNHDYLTKAYLSQAVAGLVTRLGTPWGSLSYSLDMNIELGSDQSVNRHDMVGSVISFNQELGKNLEILTEIQQNSLTRQDINRIKLDLSFVQESRVVTLDTVKTGQKKFSAGDIFPVTLTFHGDRVEEFSITRTMEIPGNLPSGQYDLYVVDAKTYSKFQSSKRLPEHRLASVDTWLKHLNDHVAADELKIILTDKTRDLIKDRFILPDVPPSMQYLSRATGTSSKQISSLKEIISRDIQLNYEVQGSSKITIQVGKKQERKK